MLANAEAVDGALQLRPPELSGEDRAVSYSFYLAMIELLKLVEVLQQAVSLNST